MLGWLILFDPGARPPVQSAQSSLFVRASSWPPAPDLSRFQESKHEPGGEFLDLDTERGKKAVEIGRPAGMPARSCGGRA